VHRYGPGDIYGDDLQAELELKGTCVARSTGPSGLRVTTLIQPLLAVIKKLSIPVAGVSKKLRRLSTVGSLRGSDARPYGGIGREE